MKEMNWYLLGVITQSLRGGSPAQRPIFNRAFQYIPALLEFYLHQENVIRSGSHTQSSQTLQATSPVLLSTSRRSQTHLVLSKVLSDSARAFSGAPETSAQICMRLRESLRLLRSSMGYFECGQDRFTALRKT